MLTGIVVITYRRPLRKPLEDEDREIMPAIDFINLFERYGKARPHPKRWK